MANDTDVAFPVLSGRDLDRLVARGHPRAGEGGRHPVRARATGISASMSCSRVPSRSSSMPATAACRHDPPGGAVHRRHRHADGAGGAGDGAGGGSGPGADAQHHRAPEGDRRDAGRGRGDRQGVPDAPADAGRGADSSGVTIIGSRFSPASHRLRDFAVRNLVPIRWMDLDSDVQAEEMLRTLGVPASDTPIVIGTQGPDHAEPVAGAVRPLRRAGGDSRRRSRLRPGRGRRRAGRACGVRVRGVRRASTCSPPTPWLPAARPAPVPGSRTTSGSPPASRDGS